jgi:hypothetical protein
MNVSHLGLRHGDFNLGERNSNFIWLGDWMGCTAGLDCAGYTVLVTVLTELLWLYEYANKYVEYNKANK